LNRQFNKYGNIEIEGNTIKYRIASKEINQDEPIEIEKDIKRKIQTIKNQDLFLLPYDINMINRYMVLYYDLSSYNSIEILRQLPFEEQLHYFLSLVQLAKAEEEENVTIYWDDKLNFVLDSYEKKVKVILFETKYLQVYEKKTPLKAIVDLMISSMTSLNKIIKLPTRNDFIDASEENISFVETIFRIDNIDDLEMFIDSTIIDMEKKDQEDEEELNDKKDKKSKLFRKKTAAPKKKKDKKKVTNNRVNSYHYNQQSNKKKPKNKDQKLFITLIVAVVGVFILLGVSNLMLPSKSASNDEASESASAVVTTTSTKDGEVNSVFKDSDKYNNDLVSAYRKAYNSNYKEAYKILSKLNKKELSPTDIELLIKVYDETNNLNKLLDEFPTVANEVITYLVTTDNLNQLTDLNTSLEKENPVIAFEVSFLEGDYKKMLSYVDKVDINGRREQQIVTGYLELEKYDDAREFANKVGNPDLISQVDSFN
jgi:hypothetical protein